MTTEAAYFASLPHNTATTNGVFGVKVMLDEDMAPTFQALRKISKMPNLSDAETTRRCFPGVKLVFLTRRDKVLQAVSYCRARQTGVWNRYTGETYPENSESSYNFDEIQAQVNDLVLREALWQTFFTSFKEPPFTIVYEDYICNPEASITSVLAFLGLVLPNDWSMPQLPMEKLADTTSTAWAQRYAEESQKKRC